ncbi:MAG: hypothetical protein MUP58_02785, partial [Candidatus Nanohaloarchaeota archaeon QJJ-9]|nr:hypothetical protein [Candidatus Nanohaloarchaeota archaeon QJJ-9]
ADRDVNLRLIFAEDDEHYVYAENITKPLDMDMFYEDYEVLGGEKTKAHPILSPGQEVPGMKYSDRIFLAGDFYHFSGLNTSVYTGKKVGEEISKCYTEG